MLAKALARSTDCSVRRVQFTPDLLPSDITGVSAYNQERREFEFKPGPVFANIVVGDEINRASPKTQSALLECMEERQVTVDGRTYPLTLPFMVIATQNPIEMEGTYPLPEAQRDRFTARISMGYPSAESELAMLDAHGSSSPLDTLEPVAQAEDIRELIAAVRAVHVAEPLKQYVIRLVGATRASPELRLGASPRATLHLLRAGRARAAHPAQHRRDADHPARAVRPRRKPDQVPDQLGQGDHARPRAGRPYRLGDHPARQRVPAAHRAAAGRGHRALLDRQQAAVHPGPDRAGWLAPAELPHPARSPRQVRHRPAERPGGRRLRPGKGGERGRTGEHPGGHPRGH